MSFNLLQSLYSALIFNQLKKEWVEKRGYCLEDLKYKTSALDVLFDEFDPTPYVSDLILILIN